jgi:translocation and assembly module TamB
LGESGKGTLNLAGSGRNFLPARLEGELELTGNNFRLLDRPDLNARVSPSLDIGIRPDAIEIGGRLEINEGRVEIRQSSTQAIAVSPDEEIYPADRRPANGSRRQINVDIGLHLGDSFRFSGYGLTGRLAGDLQVSQRGNSPTRALGTIEIHDGVYKAYGQKLEIREGLLVFQGPVTKPGLDITAVRSTPYATVGVVIGGTPGDLNSEIFSDPELPPTEAMAVLITGKPLSSATQSDANRIANAAASLGISRSAWITNKLRDSFGIDVLTLQGGEAYTESSLLVGKYLTPRLFIGYVQNLFTPQGAVELEYDLTDNLGLEARSGETQSIDLMFKIEH